MYIDTNKTIRTAEGSASRRVPLVRRSASLRLILYLTLAIIDSIALVAGYFLGAAIFPGDITSASFDRFLPFIPIFIATALFCGAYSHEALTTMHLSWSRVCKSSALTLVFAACAMIAFAETLPEPGLHHLASFGGAFAFLMMGRTLISLLVYRRLRNRIISSVFVVDGGPSADVPSGYVVLDCEDTDLAPSQNDPVLLNRLAGILSAADRIVVSCAPEKREKWSAVLKGLGVDGGILMPEFERLGMQYSSVAPGHPVILVSKGPLSLRNRVIKRALDIAITVPTLIALAIPMAIIALLIRTGSAGPVFFKQPRIGQRNHMFQIYKFRSMYTEKSDMNGNTSTQRDDDRITPIGRFIRRTSIDELPQLINVLLGDMSLVGPRPHATESRAQEMLFWEIDDRYFLRHAMKPGITGLAQVQGFRGATEKTEDLSSRLEADLAYSSQWSIWLDMAILLRTIGVVIHKNAY